VSRLSEIPTNVAEFDLHIDEDERDLDLLEASPARTLKVKLLPRRQLAHVRPQEPRPELRVRSSPIEAPIEATAETDGASDFIPAEARYPTGGQSKRLLDVAIAGTALIVLSPLIAIVALLIRTTMGRPVFFSQWRLGYGARSFQCVKFRTMVTDAETALQLHLVNNPQAALEWQERQKLQHDPRITALGHLLRRSSVDELPQLLCVLKGDMSCVGPRPILDVEIPHYGAYWREYIKVRPGLTGLWQISGRSRLSYDRRVRLDRFYVRTWSLWRDFAILVRTIPALLRSNETA
jgi:exopolysaccharide production protein ExoY